MSKFHIKYKKAAEVRRQIQLAYDELAVLRTPFQPQRED